MCTAPAMRKVAAALAAPTRAAAPPGGSVYCACHAKGSRGPSGAHARRSSSRRLCVLHLQRKRQPRPQRRPRAPQLLQEALCTSPAMRKAAAAPAAPTRAAAPPGGSVYCACHAKGSRGPSGAHARRSSSRRLCVLRLPRERQPRPQRRPRAPQFLQEALCTAPNGPQRACFTGSTGPTGPTGPTGSTGSTGSRGRGAEWTHHPFWCWRYTLHLIGKINNGTGNIDSHPRLTSYSMGKINKGIRNLESYLCSILHSSRQINKGNYLAYKFPTCEFYIQLGRLPIGIWNKNSFRNIIAHPA